jgi:hypothetical protein
MRQLAKLLHAKLAPTAENMQLHAVADAACGSNQVSIIFVSCSIQRAAVSDDTMSWLHHLAVMSNIGQMTQFVMVIIMQRAQPSPAKSNASTSSMSTGFSTHFTYKQSMLLTWLVVF